MKRYLDKWTAEYEQLGKEDGGGGRGGRRSRRRWSRDTLTLSYLVSLLSASCPVPMNDDIPLCRRRLCVVWSS